MKRIAYFYLMVFLILILNSCTNQSSISKGKVVSECVTIDEYNKTQGFGAECKNIKECKDKLNKLITLNPQIGNLSESEFNNLDCIQSSYKAIPYSTCETNEDCFKLICAGEWCKTGLKDFVYIKCITKICVGLNYFIQDQFK